MRKRGQGNPIHGAANLILILILLLSLYILFVPPAEREKILDGTTGDDDDNGGGEIEDLTCGENALLCEHPGRLSYLENKEFEHTISSFYLYKSTESVELKDINTIYVTHSSFDERSRNVSLALDDLDSLDNVLISFQAESASGVLSVMLNGEVIYENEVEEEVIDPIKLPKSMLEEENMLTFSVSETGWQFWRKNEYRLVDVKVVGDYTDLSKQQSSNAFFISDDEGANIEFATLTFLPKCDDEDAQGTLYVGVNGMEIFSKAPDCGVSNKVEFDPDFFDAGSNTVIFKTDEGSYFIEQIKVRTRLRDDASVVYHFDIEENQMRDIKVGRKHVDIVFEFVDSGKSLEGDLVVNNHRTGFQTTDPEFEKRIDPYVQEGGNAIRLVPKSNMDITNLYVRYD